jgi:thiol-disulfide isomerase/thioredoxin/phage terminase small subunit
MRIMNRHVFLTATLTALVSLTVSTPPVRAAVNVGDRPQINVRTTEGQDLTLDALRGKLVLLDFWATWCGPCMAEAPHMVETNRTYGPQGLQIVGISLDRSPADLANKKPAGFTWPQYLDTGGKVASQFGVNGIPHVYLLGPEGQVLWHGHPAGGLDAQIAKAFREHPPRLIDETAMLKATELLAQAKSAVAAGQTAQAIKLLGKVPEPVKKDAEFAAKLAEVSESLNRSAQATLAEVEPQIQAGQYGQAIPRLRELVAALNGTPAGEQARKRLAELQSDPRVKQAIERAEKETRSAEEFEAARKLKAERKDELAYRRYKTIVQLFPGTPAAAEAATAVQAYERDPAFVKRANESAAGAKAKAALSIARGYRNAGQTQLAKKKYQSIIEEFAGTSYAATAQQELKAIK